MLNLFLILLFHQPLLAKTPTPCTHLDKSFSYKITNETGTLTPTTNFLEKSLGLKDDGSLDVVIEIPAGCNDKWEVDPATGQMKWDTQNGKVRFVHYINYPWNYGMVPQTLSGDGDPLDVVVLGPALPRASVQRARIIGLVSATDHGEKDDKLVAVSLWNSPSNAFREIYSLKQLPKGINASIENFFLHYKGDRAMKIERWIDANAAREIVKRAHKKHRKK